VRFTGKTMFQEFTKGAMPPLWMWLRFLAFGGLAILLQNIGYERIGQTVLIITCVQIIGHIAAAGFKSLANGIKRTIADIRGEPIPGSPEAKKLEAEKKKAAALAKKHAELEKQGKAKANATNHSATKGSNKDKAAIQQDGPTGDVQQAGDVKPTKKQSRSVREPAAK